MNFINSGLTGVTNHWTTNHWTGLDWNLEICFYALWYAVTTNNYLDLLELPGPRDAFQL